MFKIGVLAILSFGIAFLPKGLFCQTTIGKPDIRNFFHEDTRSGAQTWRMAKDRFGTMYFANNSGLLSFNGKEWQLFRLPNKTIVRSLHISRDDRVYVGGQGEIGYFFPNNQGLMVYHSLTELIPTDSRSFGDVWDIIGFENEIFFRTTTRIYRLGKERNSFEIYEAPRQSKWSFMGASQNRIFAQNGFEGIVYFSNGIWEPINAPVLAGKMITTIQDFGKDTSLITTLTNGIFLMSRTTVWPLKLDLQITKDQLFSSLPIGKDVLAIGTVSNGIYLIDKKGKKLMHFSIENGMQNNNVLSMYLDENFNLWAGLDEGIDLINYRSPFTTIVPMPKAPRPVYTANIFNNQLFLGTSNGLFATRLTVPENENISYSQNPFRRIPNSDRQVWNLFNNSEQLLMAHHDGTFDIKTNGAVLLNNDYGGAWLYRPIPGSKSIIAGTYEGVQLFQYQNKKLIPTHKLKSNLKEPLRFIETDPLHNVIWASHPYRGIYKIDAADQFNRIEKISLLTNANGLPANTNNFVFKIESQILFATEKGIYEYDYTSYRFVISQKYKHIFGELSVKFMTEDQKKRIWFATETGMGVVERDSIKYIPELDGQLIAGFENIYPFNDANIFIGSYKGIIHLNYSLYQKSMSKISVKLNRVIATGKVDSLLFDGYFLTNGKLEFHQSTDRVPKLAPSFSSFHFDFSSNQLPGEGKIQYSYQLKGFDQEWSAWAVKNEKDYTNLSHGKYVFKVRVRDNFGNISAPILYSFVIRPKWHQTNTAYAVYIALLAFVLLSANRVQKKRLLKQKERYEKEQSHLRYVHELELEHNEKEIIKLKNEKLETEVMYKNKELATTTMHLYKRGRLIGKIKDDVTERMGKLMNKDDTLAFKKLIKLITEEEKRDQDWEQFAIHFDQVHNNFINKIKKNYPELTPGDLKICAYLKMNLSSKEIAQLLNISLKGVEIGRYRLRKKLGLQQDVNLTNFINEYV